MRLSPKGEEANHYLPGAAATQRMDGETSERLRYQLVCTEYKLLASVPSRPVKVIDERLAVVAGRNQLIPAHCSHATDRSLIGTQAP